MPPDYKYEFISLGRMKALNAAASEVNALYRESAKSATVSPEFVKRLRIISALVARAANHPLDHDDIELLEGRFGKDLWAKRDDKKGLD
jgi:hypothetical protein